jgi:nucleoside-diphosphate-sugar epimerase
MIAGKKIVVTGGAGMIGSSLIRKLLTLGAEVTAIDNLWRTGNWNNLKNAEGKFILDEEKIITRDLSIYENAIEVCKGADIIIHLAEIVAGVGFVFDNQLFLFRKNIQINSNIFHAAKITGVNKILYLGSVCSHPADKQNSPNSPPLKEEEVYPANPESAYGWSKLMGEYELELLHKENPKIDISILRLHNVYGPFCDVNRKTSQVIPSLIRKVIENDKEINVWGTGSQTRDFIFLEDVVDAIILSLEKGWNVGAIQIGSGRATSISDLVKEIIKIANKSIEIKYDLTKKEGDRGRVADYSKAQSVLGWKPKFSMEEGIAKTYKWIQERLEHK